MFQVIIMQIVCPRKSTFVDSFRLCSLILKIFVWTLRTRRVQLRGAESLRSKSFHGCSVNSSPFMRREVSLLCSQVCATESCPGPDESSPHCPHHISLRSILVLSFDLLVDLQSGLFHSGFPTKICMHFPSLSYLG
jgi:hypothetical protein